ncbi:MAG: tetratricopeptide repeat protein [Planctomycetota bacterium]|nr:MAG: tetratricopeptide repeat protein [Planctomycetota bacterium]
MKNLQKHNWEKFEADVQLAIENKNWLNAQKLLYKHFAHYIDKKEIYGYFVQVLLAQNQQQAAKYFLEALENFQHQSLFRIGCYFADQNLHFLAIPALQKALQLAPNHPDSLYELARCLRLEGRPNEALQLLQQHPQKHNFWVQLEKGWNSLLLQDTSSLHHTLTWLDEHRWQAPPNQQTEVEFAYTRLADAFQRYLCLPHPPSSEQDWHFVLYGAVGIDFLDILHQPNHFQIPTFGEYLYLTLQTLKSLFPPPQRVLALEEENSQLLAKILSVLLRLPYQIYHQNSTRKGSLVVAANAKQFSSLWQTIYPNEVLLAGVLPLHQHGFICPDFSILCLQEEFFYPWQLPHFSHKSKLLKLLEKQNPNQLEKFLGISPHHLPSLPYPTSLLIGANPSHYPLGRYPYWGENYQCRPKVL